ncbi:Leucine-rich repeat receptor-like protein kinase PXC2 [Striga hermonthica]|uniref:Leucine-rich repeat receptor-like protein kinase PXC2 n=1 Tax=Striga hermonthica TaxID=68872 RepID=A0A9N7RMI5_STRHE|nr:Leucine-rich repeat receptor-like protein kinase PXC2 [Striga hermonthica]
MSKLVNLVTVLFLFPLLVVQSADEALNDDVLVLIAVKSALIDPQSKLASWTEDASLPCNWVGVTCYDDTGGVSELNLDGFSLSGHISKILIRLQHLKVLHLSRNNFSGNINPALTQIPALQIVDFSENSLSGTMPEELFQQCGSLKEISFASNNLTGMLPQSLSSCSKLETLNLSSNRLSGQLPSALWSLASLQTLDLSGNWFEGEIPGDMGSLYNLRAINFGRNSFVGSLPENIGNFSSLYSVDFGRNHFGGGLPLSLKELRLSCKYLDVSGNFLSGQLPNWIGEMRSLEFLDLSGNSFSGRIPSTIGNLQYLNQVNLSNNRFMGYLPESIRDCFNLKVLAVDGNLLSGNLPSWVFNLALETISLSRNRYTGSLSFPAFYLQTYQSLQVLDLSSNILTGQIPWAIGNFRRLQALNLSHNLLFGLIPPSVGQLNATSVLDMSRNHLSGAIPVNIKNCSSLTSLILSGNNLSGSIPSSIASLSNLELLDISFNNLSGSIPNELTNLSHIISFNVSFNHLEGGIPFGGFFSTIPTTSFIGNPLLCRQSCPAAHQKPLVLNPNSSVANRGPLSPDLRHKRIVLSISSLVAIGAAIVIALGVVTVSILNMHARTATAQARAALAFSGGDDISISHESSASYGKLVMFSGEVDFTSTGAHGLLAKNAELGRGGFGTVYLTKIQGGKRAVAIKKLNTTSLVKSREEFEREIKKLGKIRHENLVALEGYYWTPSLQLLINEYVSCGSLHKHLHDAEGTGGGLTWQQRFKIILGTASGLAHLHRTNVIHYNMKSANVLIDSCGEPKVGDFGLARLLPALDRYILSSKIQSALGYMAPEYACQTVKITEKCDVYGFGILTLEVVTGKRPVEYMEDDVVVLCDMVREALDEGRVEECIDKRLGGNYPVEEAVPVVKLGLICASQVPSNRPDMEEVTRILELIRCPAASQEELLE